jgi:hypothetical protein
MIGHVGTICTPNGRCLVPAWPWGIAWPVDGAALVLRDLVQRRLDRWCRSSPVRLCRAPWHRPSC